VAQVFKRLPQSMLISPRRASKRDFEGLTQREREVASLVALGKTNQVIAQDLTLSERTIEKHIENIMSKLGFNARSQIAVWAVEKNLSNKLH
jgi:DNA-binding NarL/FixJ family response regulator